MCLHLEKYVNVKYVKFLQYASLQVFSRFGVEVPAVLFRLERPSPICLRRDDDGGFIGLFVRVAQEAAVTVNTNVLALKEEKWMMDFCMCY